MASRARHVTGLDITIRMLELARLKPAAGEHRVGFVAGDMMALPFEDGTFTVVTTGYGLRNVPELPVALTEIARVLAPGGLLLSLDFNRPGHPVARSIYLAYLTIVGSVLGAVLHGEPDTYRYIPESIRRLPGGGGRMRADPRGRIPVLRPPASARRLHGDPFGREVKVFSLFYDDSVTMSRRPRKTYPRGGPSALLTVGLSRQSDTGHVAALNLFGLSVRPGQQPRR